MNVKKMIQYKADTLIGIASNFLTQFSAFVFIWAVFGYVERFEKWSYGQILLLYGTFTICRGLNNIFFDNLWIVGKEYIRRGTFDILVTRPANVLFQIIGEKVQLDGFGTLVLGIVTFNYGIRKEGMYISFENLIIWLGIFLMGTLIIAEINLIFTVSSFWVVRSNNIIWMFFSLADFGQYPLDIFGFGIKCMLTCILPYGFVAYYPVCAMLGKISHKILAFELGIVFLFGIISICVWRMGVKKYESTGN